MQHAIREVNRVANALAKLGCEIQEHFVILENSPSNVILAIVYSEAIGVNFCRLTASNITILA